MFAWIEAKKKAATSFYHRYERYWHILFFIGGFISDLTLLDRVDSFMVVGQQVLFIVLLWCFLVQMLVELRNPPELEKKHPVIRFYYHHRIEAMHFLFGGLLNAYMIYYFKSASIIASAGYLLFLVGLLILNELPRFRSLGLPFKFALLSLCTYSFFAFLIPSFIGSMNSMLFLFSCLLGYTPFALSVALMRQRSSVYYELLKTNALLPATIMLIVFLGAYFLRLTPPVPLSMPFIGIYHSVDKTSEGYKLGSEKEWWKFWLNGDQEFKAQPGDKIYVYFRIQSPARFSDDVVLKWLFRDPRLGWQVTDKIPIRIQGKREEGYRGLGNKGNYQPGSWRVQVETKDEREIGRIYFDLELVPQTIRELQYDTD